MLAVHVAELGEDLFHAFVPRIERAEEQAQLLVSVLGEVDHPDDLKINLDRVSHMITNMYMNENNGIGKLKILPTPMGNIVKTLLESGVKRQHLRAHSDFYVNPELNRWALSHLSWANIMAESKGKNLASFALFEEYKNVSN